MDGTYGIGSGGRPRFMSRGKVAAACLGVLALVVTGLIVFFPKARTPASVVVAPVVPQQSRPPTTAPAAMVLPPVRATVVPAKPVAAVKVAKTSRKAKTIAKGKRHSSSHALVRSKAKSAKAVAVRKGQPRVRTTSQG